MHRILEATIERLVPKSFAFAVIQPARHPRSSGCNKNEGVSITSGHVPHVEASVGISIFALPHPFPILPIQIFAKVQLQLSGQTKRMWHMDNFSQTWHNGTETEL